MSDVNFHKECKNLSEAVYKNNYGKTINGWICLDYKHDKNGFYAETYKKGNSVIVAVRGTEKESVEDLKNDLYIGAGFIPKQLETAKEYISYIMQKYGETCNISLTGHSLGGSIVQAIGTETGLETVTFSAYGIGDLVNINEHYSDNITNYGCSNDIIFMKNIDNQIGTTKVLGSEKVAEGTFLYKDAEIPNYSETSKFHKLENYPDLSTAKEYVPKNGVIGQFNKPLYKAGVVENVFLSDEDRVRLEKYARENELFSPENRVFFDGEMNPVQVPADSPDNNYVEEFIKQYFDNNKNLPQEDDLKQRVQSGELIYVHNYERQDGTKVSGYYRSKPSR